MSELFENLSDTPSPLVAGAAAVIGLGTVYMLGKFLDYFAERSIRKKYPNEL